MEPTAENRVDKTPQRIQTMFDAIAPWYDFLNHTLSLGIDRRWRRLAARKLIVADSTNHGLGARPNSSILDVCCGTGDLIFSFRKRLLALSQQENWSLNGIDFSSEMIDIARKKDAKTQSDEKIDFQVGDALNLPFESNFFALVSNAFGLRNVGDTERGLAEMVRVCKPGGIVAVLEFSMPTNPIFRIPYRFYFRNILPRIGQFFSKSRDDAYRYLPDSVLQFDEPEQLACRMKSLGLVELQTIPMTFGIATLTFGKKAPTV